MSSAELSLFSYEILGLVGRAGAGAHDLLQMARRGRILAWAGESQYYSEPKRLARLGYLETRREPGKTRERTVYTLTDKGLAALREYPYMNGAKLLSRMREEPGGRMFPPDELPSLPLKFGLVARKPDE